MAQDRHYTQTPRETALTCTFDTPVPPRVTPELPPEDRAIYHPFAASLEGRSPVLGEYRCSACQQTFIPLAP